MARISTYPIDANLIQDKDSWIGTQYTNTVTRNFTALSVAEYIDTKAVGKVFVGAVAGAPGTGSPPDGVKGLVPAPLGGQEDYFLKGDGDWSTLPVDPNTTYTLDVPLGTTSINLKGSDATNDAIVLTDGVNITISRTDASTLDIAGTEYTSSWVDSAADIILRLAKTGAATGNQDIKMVAGANVTLSWTDANNFTIASTQENTEWYVRDSADADETVDHQKYLKFVTATGSLGTALTGAGSTGDPFLMTLTSPDTTYSVMTESVLGLGKLWDNAEQTTIAVATTTTGARTYGIQLNSDDQLVVNVPWTSGGTYTLPVATSTTLGGVKLEDDTEQTTAANTVSTTAGRTYGLQLNSSDQGVINVPWTDTDYNKWILEGDNTGVSPQDITSGTTATFVGGTYLTTVAAATRQLTINHNLTSRTDNSPTASPSPGGSLALVSAVATGVEGHVTTVDTTTVTWPADTNTTYILDKALGSTDLILSANGSTQDTITFSGTSNEVEVTGVAEDAYVFGLPDDVTITGELTVSGTGQSSFGGQLTIPVTPSATTDAASKGYVDGLVAGGLTFKGTFNALTGAIVGGGGTYLYQLTGTDFDPTAARVAVAVGDYYVVATAGNFYGSGGTGTCATTQALDIGDSIIATTLSAANDSVCADWSIIQSDEGVVDFTNTFGTFISGTDNANAVGAVTLGTIDLSATGTPGATNFLRGDNSWVVPTDTTYVAMTTSTLGLGKLRYSTGSTPAAVAQQTAANRTYGITANASDQLVVNIPWTDSTYSVFTAAPSAVANGTPGLVPGPLAATFSAPTTYFLNADAQFSIPTGTYSLPVATSTILGGIELGSDTALTQTYETGVTGTASRTYPVQLNSARQAAVSVPWTDTDYDKWIADSDEGTTINVETGDTLMFTGAVETAGAGIATDSAVSAGEMTIGLINAGGTAGATTFYRGDGQWAVPAGTGVTGSGTLNTVPRWTATGSNLGDGPIVFDDATSAANSAFGGEIYIPTAHKIKFDGSAGHTYIVEESDNVLKFYTGGSEDLNLTSGSATFTTDITASKNQNATSTFTFQNTDTTDGSSRTYFKTIAGDRSIELQAYNGDHTYINRTAGVNLYIQRGGTTDMIIGTAGAVQLSAYGSGTNTGTEAYNLAVDSSGNIIETTGSGGGGGTAKGGTFSKVYTTGAVGAAGIAFTISRATTGIMIFDVMLTSDTSTACAVAKKYTVVKSYGASPLYSKILDTGPDYDTSDFTVVFEQSTTDLSIKCTITPVYTATQKIGITIDLGYGENDATVVMN